MMKYVLVALFVAAVSAVDYHDQDFCKGLELNRNYKHPESCEKYIACDDSSRAHEMPCPGDLQFVLDDTVWGHCETPEVAKCTIAPVCEGNRCHPLSWKRCCKGTQCKKVKWGLKWTCQA